MEIPKELADRYAGREDVEILPFEGKYSTGWIIRIGKPTEYHLRNVLELIKSVGEMALRDQVNSSTSTNPAITKEEEAA